MGFNRPIKSIIDFVNILEIYQTQIMDNISDFKDQNSFISQRTELLRQIKMILRLG
ncbi:MAG: hypothetical protein ACI8X3_002188 [Saprospiraceae bacterium]|jgi:hypothetical protein